jgi:hypothetical protein
MHYTARRVNGELMQKIIKDQMNSWKAGKFIHKTSLPCSLNCYSLSKLWYKMSCLDMRVGDSNTITSNIKGWLYHDMLLKPQEMMLYRQTELGIYNVKLRASMRERQQPFFFANFFEELNIHSYESCELPAGWVVSTCLNMVWGERLGGRRATCVVCQDCTHKKYKVESLKPLQQCLTVG